MHRAVGQSAQVRPVPLANLTPSNRHRAEKPADEAAEEDRRRDWDRNSRNDERHQGGKKGLEIDDRRDDDRVSVTQCELEHQQAKHPDRKQNSKLAIVGGIPEQHNQLAATSFARDQQGKRYQQGDLTQENKLRETEPFSRQKRKRLLHRKQERGDEGVNASKLIIYPSFLRRRQLHPDGPESPALQYR